MKNEGYLPLRSAAFKEACVDVKGINTHVLQAGSGAPLLCIHGFMGNAFDWRNNIDELGTRFAVKAFDLPGFGYSDKPLDFDYSSKGYADFVVSFLDVCGIEDAVLVGNSLGGQIALKTCQEYAARVSALVLIDPGGYPGSVKFPLFRLLKAPLIGSLVMSFATRLSTRYVLDSILIDKASVDDEVVACYYNVYATANARKIPPLVVKNVIKDEADLSVRLSEIRCPTLIIWGARDNVIPSRYGPLLQQQIRGSSLMTIADAGHMPQIDRPDAVNKAIADFVNPGLLLC